MELVVRVDVVLADFYLLPDLQLLSKSVIHDPDAVHQFGKVISRGAVKHRHHRLAGAVLQPQRDV